MALDALTRIGAIVSDFGNPALADHIRRLWDSKMGYSYDLELQDLWVRAATVFHLLGNLDSDDDPKYQISNPDGAKNREERRRELLALQRFLAEQIKGYVVAGTGSGAPSLVTLDATAPIEISGWPNPNSPGYYGSPFHDSFGSVRRWGW